MFTTSAPDVDSALLRSPPVAQSRVQSAIHKAHRKPSGLLDLPAEIWSKIGKLVVDDGYHFRECHFDGTEHPAGPEGPIYDEPEFEEAKYCHQPDITRTCHALRAELLPYFYRENVRLTFFAPRRTSSEQIELIGRFLRSVAPQYRKHLQARLRNRATGEHGDWAQECFELEMVSWRVPCIIEPLEGDTDEANETKWYDIRFL